MSNSEIMNKLIVLVFASFFAAFSNAEGLETSPFEYSKEIKRDVGAVSHHRLVLSTPKKINNVFRFENEKHVDGLLNTKLVQIEPGHDSDVVFNHYLDQFIARGGDLVFQCKSRACGVSNHWANTIFKETRLYGRDSEQYYYVGSAEIDGQVIWQYVYVVKRGNKKVYALVAELKEKEANGKIAWLKGKRFDSYPNAKALDELKALMASVNGPELLVVAYSSKNTELSKSVSESSQRAESVADKLRQDLNANSITHLGIGILALEGASPSNSDGLMIKLFEAR